jgi:hypothetical protein
MVGRDVSWAIAAHESHSPAKRATIRVFIHVPPEVIMPLSRAIKPEKAAFILPCGVLT